MPCAPGRAWTGKSSCLTLNEEPWRTYAVKLAGALTSADAQATSGGELPAQRQVSSTGDTTFTRVSASASNASAR